MPESTLVFENGVSVIYSYSGAPGPTGAAGADGATTWTALTDTATDEASIGELWTADGAGGASWQPLPDAILRRLLPDPVALPDGTQVQAMDGAWVIL